MKELSCYGCSSLDARGIFGVAWQGCNEPDKWKKTEKGVLCRPCYCSTLPSRQKRGGKRGGKKSRGKKRGVRKERPLVVIDGAEKEKVKVIVIDDDEV